MFFFGSLLKLKVKKLFGNWQSQRQSQEVEESGARES